MKDVGPTISILSILTSLSVYAPVRCGINPANPFYSRYQSDDDLSYYNFFSNLPSQNSTNVEEFEDLEDKYRNKYDVPHQENDGNFVVGKSKHFPSPFSEDGDEKLGGNKKESFSRKLVQFSSNDENFGEMRELSEKNGNDLSGNSEDYKDESDGLDDGRIWHSKGLYRKTDAKPNRFVQEFQWLDYSRPKVKLSPSHGNKRRVAGKQGVDKRENKGDGLRELPNTVMGDTSLKGQETEGSTREYQERKNDERGKKEEKVDNDSLEKTRIKILENLGDFRKVDNKGRDKDEMSDRMREQKENPNTIGDKEKEKSDRTNDQRVDHDKMSDKEEKDDKMNVDHDRIHEKEEKSDKTNGKDEKSDQINDKKEEHDKEATSDRNDERATEENEKISHEPMENTKEILDKDGKKFDQVDGDGAVTVGPNKDKEGKSINSAEKKDEGCGKDKKEGPPKENNKCGTCNGPVKPDIVTGQVYPTVVKEPYSTVTGFWSRGLEQRFQSGFESARTLKVIVVPFSHNDAAWLKTFDEYYYEKSRKILDNLTQELIKYKDMTFVWSEICFLSRWWKSASRQSREDFLDLVRTNRVEICPGGWVMPDEACPHLFALIVQLTEGHLWVKDNLGVLPKVGWSIDPFGHSSTMAYLLKEAGLTQGNVIQRVHFGWKSYFSKMKAGDFMWKQSWDNRNRHGLLTHNQPFNIYSASMSCGPHPEVCRQFDFNLSTATPITFENVKMRTELLFSEYWRTGSLFPHNVVMVPLGDDFRYTNPREFGAQYKNYKAIMDYGNSDKKLRTEISFGTPSDYFRLATRRLCKTPILEGDFFPYADYDEHGPAYWTGFYSTRPHHKKLTRVAEWNLRSAEILFTLALNLARQNKIKHDDLRRLYLNLINARRQISLFQHHDGITGTSKAYVMEDFRNRLIEANTNSILVQSGAIQYILGAGQQEPIDYSPTNLTPLSFIIKEKDLASSIATHITPNFPQKIVVFNSLGSQRQDVLRIIVSNPCVEIKDVTTGKMASYQVNPVWFVHKFALYQPANFTRVFVKKTEYELLIVLDLEPLSVKVYEIAEFGPDKCCFVKTLIERAESEEEEGNSTENDTLIPPNFRRPHNFASVYSLTKSSVDTSGIFTSKIIQVDWLMLENDEIVIGIDRDSGFLMNIKKKATNETFKVELDYHSYDSERGSSGAYIFKPTGNQTNPDCTDIEFMVIHGPVITECILIFHGVSQHTTRVYHVSGPLSQAVQVESIINLATSDVKENTELFLKLKTNIKNGDPPVFYSDSNGFEMHRRQRVCGAGIETNYYPSTTCVYIEDENTRLSILTEQSHGVSSNREGQLEMMMDRKLYEDDGRGMGEGVLDTRKAVFSYFLLLEQFKSTPQSPAKLSLLAHTLIDFQTYPMNVFYSKPFDTRCPTPKYNALLTNGLPCDMRIVNLRTYSHPNTENYPLNSALMTMHRRAYLPHDREEKEILKNTCSLHPKNNCSSGFLKGTRFKHVEVAKMMLASLTGLYEGEQLTCLDHFSIESFEIKSMRIDFK